MNRLLEEMKLRQLPDHLIDDYLAGRCSAESEKLVEALRHLPENYLKFLLTPVAEVEPGPDIGSPEEESGLSDTYDQTSAIDAAAGQIWSVKNFLGSDQKLDVLPIAGHQLVFLLTNPHSLSDEIHGQTTLKFHLQDRFVEFLPVSFYTEFANHEDMIFPAQNDLLGVEFMIETGITSLCLEEDLDHYYGTLSQEDAEKLLNLYFRTNGMEFEQDLIDDTILGNRREARGTVYDKFKEIEFENAQIIAEPVEKLRLRLEEIRIIRIPYPVKFLAAAQEELNVAGETPDLTISLHEDENLLLQINHYPKLGYYFVVNVASEFCNSEFTFSVEYFAGTPIKLERECPIPRKYHFAFYPEFKDGLYRISIAAGANTLWAKEFVIEMEKK